LPDFFHTVRIGRAFVSTHILHSFSFKLSIDTTHRQRQSDGFGFVRLRYAFTAACFIRGSIPEWRHSRSNAMMWLAPEMPTP
jgi:hypothetical protein